MSIKNVKIALVGCGGMAQNYRKTYTQIPGAELAIVIDNVKEVARSVAEELGLKKWSTEFGDALTNDIDIVDISTPNFLHKEQAVVALNAGKHVIIQKPIATTTEDAEEILLAAHKAGKKIGMYMSMFDNALYYDIKKLITQRLLGKVSSVYYRGAGIGGIKMQPTNWRNSKEKTGGGAFIQLAIHGLNMFQWILEERIVRVAAFSKNYMCPNIGGDDITNAVCEFESGIQGTLEASYCSIPNILAVYGSNGYLLVVNNCNVEVKLDNLYVGEVIKYNQPKEILCFKYIHSKENNPYDQHTAFVKAIQNGKPVPISAEMGVYDLKVVKAVYKAAEEGKVIEVE